MNWNEANRTGNFSIAIPISFLIRIHWKSIETKSTVSAKSINRYITNDLLRSILCLCFAASLMADEWICISDVFANDCHRTGRVGCNMSNSFYLQFDRIRSDSNRWNSLMLCMWKREIQSEKQNDSFKLCSRTFFFE